MITKQEKLYIVILEKKERNSSQLNYQTLQIDGLKEKFQILNTLII